MKKFIRKAQMHPLQRSQVKYVDGPPHFRPSDDDDTASRNNLVT